MAKFKNEKLITAIGMGLTGYYGVSAAFAALPKLPSLITDPFMGGISVLTLGAAATLWGVYVLYGSF